MSTTEGRPALMRGFVLALLLLGVSGGQALAHRSPSNCNANRLTLSLDQNPAGSIVSGQTVTYTVGVLGQRVRDRQHPVVEWCDLQLRAARGRPGSYSTTRT